MVALFHLENVGNVRDEVFPRDMGVLEEPSVLSLCGLQGECEMSEGELSKRAIRMEEIDDLVVKMLDVEEAKASFPSILYPETLPHKGKEPWCNPEEAAKWFERWFGTEKKASK